MSTNSFFEESRKINSDKTLSYKQKVKLRKKLKEDLNPCLAEETDCGRCSLDVLGELSREFCNEAYKNYKNCTKFWNNVQKDRKKHGVKPHLPAIEDREQVRQEYFKKWGDKKFNSFQMG